MVTEIFVIACLLVLLLFLLIMMTEKNRSPGKMIDKIPPEEEEQKNPIGSKCPLCGEFLPRGEKVHSHLFSGTPDGIMHIFGCPHCYEDHPQGSDPLRNNRICPYCHETLGKDDYLIARVFEKPGRKTQVHVLGCTICREKRN